MTFKDVPLHKLLRWLEALACQAYASDATSRAMAEIAVEIERHLALGGREPTHAPQGPPR
mgnify:CR=1 FL=1